MVQYKRPEPPVPLNERPSVSLKERFWLDPTTSAGLDALLTRVGRGDQAALAALYDQTGPAVFGMLNRQFNDRAQAERLTTRIYAEAWRTAPRYDPATDTPPSWLLVLIHRQLTNATAHQPA